LVAADEQTPAVALIPGDDVSLHRLVLTGANPAERLAEARMRATDLAGQPVEELHVAVGPPDAEGASWVALIDRQRMAAHLGHLEAAGVRPRHLLPAALLLPQSGSSPAMARLGDQLLLRTDAVAGLVEPELAAALTGADRTPDLAPLAEFAPDAAPDPLPLDLLQGAFAPRRRWWAERSFLLASGLLAALLLALLLAPTLIERVRQMQAVAGYDRATMALAEQALGKRPADAAAAAAALADARRRAEAGALGARLSFAARTVETVPGARLETARLQPDGTLLLTLGGPADAINAVGPRMAAGPFVTRANGTSLTIGDRQAGRPARDSALSVAMLRLVQARQDAALAGAARARPPMTPAAVTAALAAAGLADPTAAAEGAIAVPSARSTVLLPLIADLERQGAHFTGAEIRRNADATLAVRLEVTP
jgi:general secretion pathway protein L